MGKPQVKLKIVAEEIKEILRKHDVAGAIALHCPGEGEEGHGEHIVHLTTSYSCVYQHSDNEIRLYSKKEDYKNKEEQFKKQGDTSNMLTILTACTAFNFDIVDRLSKALDEQIEAVHTKGIQKH